MYADRYPKRATRITRGAEGKRAVAFGQKLQGEKREEPAGQGKLFQDLLALNQS